MKKVLNNICEWEKDYYILLNSNDILCRNDFKLFPSFSLLYFKDYIRVYKLYKNLDISINKHNEILQKDIVSNFNELCGKIEGNYLDSNQITSIVSNSMNSLIIAGAGSGKTTTIIGKIKYLINNNICSSEDILLLSFTNKSAYEMKERVHNELGLYVDTFTFHKLGLEIIKGVYDNVNIYTDNIGKLIISIINELLISDTYAVNFIYYVINNICMYKYTSIDKKVYRNKYDTMLSIYLFINNIKYKYRKVFYLVDYNLYISSINDIKDNIIKKRISVNSIWKYLCYFNRSVYISVSSMFEMIISLIKSNNYSINDLEKLITKDSKLLFELVKPIFIKYNEYLINNKLIDFNDMINLSTNIVKENKYIHKYKYVIVDEYQDISLSRYKLLLAMRKQNNYKLFCVGDDWQSIYRFSGSDVGLITNFSKYWGDTKIYKIEHTYRFSSKLANISSKFIMKNNNQIKKNIIGREGNCFPIEIIYGSSDNNLINEFINMLYKLPNYSKVFLLGRYTFDIDILRNNKYFNIEYNYITKSYDIILDKRVDLDINFLTIHKSKGLQSDYVFILNNKDELMGFPSKVKDSSLVNSLLDNSDNYLYSEERRLFYVSITRCKVKTYLLVNKYNKSIFIKEIEKMIELFK